MKIYLVGGAVRDKLLGLPITEQDWVVVGSTPEALLSQGYKPIGKDFPVFLHPMTHEEYALARTERKMGKGYKGFICYAAPDVTLEEDLLRRDLTINAMAQDEEGGLIDPYGGQADLNAKILRHISDAFSEDPVRVLRLARFAARFAGLGFIIAEETKHQVQKILASGELVHLVPERVWQELEKALNGNNPRVFFDVLAETQALSVIFPAWSELYQEHNLKSLQKAVSYSSNSPIRLASLLQCLCVKAIKQGCETLRIPKQFADLAILAAQYRENFKVCQTLSSNDLLVLLEKLDAFRRVERFEDLLQVWQANVTLASGNELADFLRLARQRAIEVDVSALIEKTGLQGEALRDRIREERVKVL
jgi:tRNA nucleotidyltransferase (CCA-adding enzyme)